jgi:hypothetical protein
MDKIYPHHKGARCGCKGCKNVQTPQAGVKIAISTLSDFNFFATVGAVSFINVSICGGVICPINEKWRSLTDPISPVFSRSLILSMGRTMLISKVLSPELKYDDRPG